MAMKSSYTTPWDTIHEFGTEIASLSGQSLIGKSDDADSYIAAGYFKDLEYYPKYNKSDLGGINFDRQTLFKEGEAFVTGLVINKNNGTMRARVYQNQADPGQRTKYNISDTEYECAEVSNSLEEFTTKNINALIDDMKASESRIKGLISQKQKMREQEDAERRKRLKSENEQEVAVNNAQKENNSKNDFTADRILNEPDVYADIKSNSATFSLKCVDEFNNTYRMVAFKDNMSNYPILRYKHNEQKLIADNKLSLDNLIVKTSVEGYYSDIPTFEDKKATGFMLKFDKNIAGDTFSAGQYLVGNIQQSENTYVGANIEQLREGRSMPDLLRARNKKQEITQSDIVFGDITLDRKTLDTVIRMDIEGKHKKNYEFSCQLSQTPKEDAKDLLIGGVKAIKDEQSRIGKYAKNEEKNRI
jgi:hypothetical protein